MDTTEEEESASSASSASSSTSKTIPPHSATATFMEEPSNSSEVGDGRYQSNTTLPSPPEEDSCHHTAATASANMEESNPATTPSAATPSSEDPSAYSPDVERRKLPPPPPPPAAAAAAATTYLTPTISTPSKKKKKSRTAAMVVPKSAPATTSSKDLRLQQLLSSSTFKPPLVASSLNNTLNNTSHHSSTSRSSLLIESGQYQAFSGYGRPDEFVTPTRASGQQRRSWKPKEGASPRKDMTSFTGTITAGASYTSPIKDSISLPIRPPLLGSHEEVLLNNSPGGQQSFCSSSSSPAPNTPDTTDSTTPSSGSKWRGAGVPKTAIMEVAAPPLLGGQEEDEDDGHPRTEEYYYHSPKPSQVASQEKKSSAWKKRLDPKDLPPAFQAAHRAASQVALQEEQQHQYRPPPPPQSPGRSSWATTTRIDPDTLERIRPAPKEKLIPAKLKRKWPPITRSSSSASGTDGSRSSSSSTNRLSFLRALGAVSNDTVKQRRHVFENNNNIITMTTTTTAVDLALQLIATEKTIGRNKNTNHHDVKKNSDDDDDDDDGNELVRKVRELLCDKVVVDVPEDDNDVDIGGGGAVTEVRAATTTENGHMTRGELLSKLRVQTSMKIRWGGPTYHTIEGRPLYYLEEDGITMTTYVDENGQELPLAPLIEDRFGAYGSKEGLYAPSSSRRRDTALACPRRSRSFDDWSDDESLYTTIDDEEEETEPLEEGCDPEQLSRRPSHKNHHGRPTVWIAPSVVDDEDGTMKETRTEDTWRVKRVWDEPTIDVHEPEFLVHQDHLMRKVKQLLGLPLIDTSTSDAVAPSYDPKADTWCMKKVYDIDGEIQGVSGTMKVSENGISCTFAEVARTASMESFLSPVAEIEKIIADTPSMTGHNDDDSDVVKLNHSEGSETMVGNGKAEDAQVSITVTNEDVVRSSSTSTPASPPSDSPVTPASKKNEGRNKKGRKSKKEDADLTSVWDLLSPPPVLFFTDAE